MLSKRKAELGILVVVIVAPLILARTSKDLSTEIEIKASSTKIWTTLTDLNRYSEWNPHIREAEGEVVEGAKLTIRIEERNGKSMTFQPAVTRVIPERELRWLGHLLFPGVFDGEHIFEIRPSGEGTVRFVQREYFRGVLVPFLWGKLNTDTRAGFEEMNVALKRRVEE